MNVTITSKNLKASDYLLDIIESKLQKLDKYFKGDIDAHVTLSLEKGRQGIEATINARGIMFRAEDNSTDIYSSIDKVVDRLANQMSKYKKKLVKRHKDKGVISFDDIPDIIDPSEDDSDPITIARRKKFSLHPMSPEEAILQMELLGHTFFVFLDMETSSIGVVYKRNDATYGLLETEI
ncbi:MAG: ribosome-associated translation inhibitor RaiA [Clostridiales Family XIII bacterium]|jgi:putative sigma-54 modulation protein|nr:ribosome-associated translation inhibitor RaiA [Clostridiales Family XIII bacterium]